MRVKKVCSGLNPVKGIEKSLTIIYGQALFNALLSHPAGV
jgi:hypothetical protein